MDAQKRDSNWRVAFRGKKVLPAEEVLSYITKIESDGRIRELTDIVAKADGCYLTGSTVKQKELKQKILQIKRSLIESHPKELVIMKNGLFWSVCCDEMKDAVLNEDITSAIDTDSGAFLIVKSPEIMAKMQNTEDKDYPDDYSIATGQCPFCGADLYERPVSLIGSTVEILDRDQEATIEVFKRST